MLINFPTKISAYSSVTYKHVIATISVDINGVFDLLNELDISKAAGPDNIPAHFLKLCAIEVAPILTLIFQASIHQFSFSPDWKQANNVPIFKTGDRTLCSNYIDLYH